MEGNNARRPTIRPLRRWVPPSAASADPATSPNGPPFRCVRLHAGGVIAVKASYDTAYREFDPAVALRRLSLDTDAGANAIGLLTPATLGH